MSGSGEAQPSASPPSRARPAPLVSVRIVPGPARTPEDWTFPVAGGGVGGSGGLPDGERGPPGGTGGLVTFHGVVRPMEEGRRIRGLEYESYDPMAERVLRELAEEAADRHGLLGLRVIHSRGFVPAGACSLVVEAAGAHRREGLEAVAWFISRMKEDVPIWKRAVPADEEAPSRTEPGGRA
jgi:molybdopterin synthase catalytic subunit